MRWLRIYSLLGSLVLTSCAGSANVPWDYITTPMGTDQARKIVKLMKGLMIGDGTSIASKSNNINNVVVRDDYFTINNQYRFRFSELPQLSLSLSNFGKSPAFLLIGDKVSILTGYGETGNDAARVFASALLVLKRESSGEAASRAADEFATTVRNYRTAETKPTLSENSRRYKVQAESAAQAKDFENAADLYSKALYLAPWWPEGHFNRALILGEVGDFESAIKEMRRYLRLVPDAPDARAAQDRIYEWEAAAKK